MKTLLLNVTCEPIRLISWQKAITLFLLNKVNIISEYDNLIHSCYLTFKVPAVVRLRKYHKFKDRVKLTREHIYARDQFICQYCGKEFDYGDLTLDHILPQSRGGKYSWKNLVACCDACNNKKDNKTPEEANMPLLRQPTSPNWLPEILVKEIKTKNVPTQWTDWIGWVK